MEMTYGLSSICLVRPGYCPAGTGGARSRGLVVEAGVAGGQQSPMRKCGESRSKGDFSYVSKEDATVEGGPLNQTHGIGTKGDSKGHSKSSGGPQQTFVVQTPPTGFKYIAEQEASAKGF